jgi:general secretion pathway protein K
MMSSKERLGGRSQRGAAILMAMLMVVLVATLASGMLWQQWRGVEVETAQRARVQSTWILTGALDWARLILREDARQGGADHLAEPWAVPLEPARLSTFLAAEHGQALVGEDTDPDQEAFLSGHIQDLQARLNLTNLVDNDKLHKTSVAAWTKLFKHLNLPERELQTMTQNLLLAYVSASDAKSNKPTLLWPQAATDLTWLGLSAKTVQALKPFVTVLPVRTPVNLNTAPPEVLLASVPGMDMAMAQSLVKARETRHMATLVDADQLLNKPDIHFDANEHGVASRFFSVTGQLRFGQARLQELSVIQRDGLDVKILSRTREAFAVETAPLQ